MAGDRRIERFSKDSEEEFIFTLMDEAQFYEEQKFTQKWLLAIIYAVWVMLAGAALLLFIGKKTGIWPPIELLLSGTVFVVGFKSLRLQCKITGDAITYRFYPLQRRFRVIPKSDITHLEVVTYKPIRDYGGWGIRIGQNGMAYNVKGDKGVLIRLASQKNILIGTSKPEKMEAFLKKQRYL
jgi:hypothetical protein